MKTAFKLALVGGAMLALSGCTAQQFNDAVAQVGVIGDNASFTKAAYPIDTKHPVMLCTASGMYKDMKPFRLTMETSVGGYNGEFDAVVENSDGTLTYIGDETSDMIGVRLTVNPVNKSGRIAFFEGGKQSGKGVANCK